MGLYANNIKCQMVVYFTLLVATGKTMQLNFDIATKTALNVA